jgi:hypothetical protein
LMMSSILASAQPPFRSASAMGLASNIRDIFHPVMGPGGNGSLQANIRTENRISSLLNGKSNCPLADRDLWILTVPGLKDLHNPRPPLQHKALDPRRLSPSLYLFRRKLREFTAYQWMSIGICAKETGCTHVEVNSAQGHDVRDGIKVSN